LKWKFSQTPNVFANSYCSQRTLIIPSVVQTVEHHGDDLGEQSRA
jgi:hypothetical protein